MSPRRALLECDEPELFQAYTPRRAAIEPAQVAPAAVAFSEVAPAVAARRIRRPLVSVCAALLMGTVMMGLAQAPAVSAAAPTQPSATTIDLSARSGAVTRDLARTDLSAETVTLGQAEKQVAQASAEQAAMFAAAVQDQQEQQVRDQATTQFAADKAASAQAAVDKAAAEKAAADKIAADRAAAEQAAAAQAATRRAAATQVAQNSAAAPAAGPVSAPPASGAAAVALRYALAQVGKPYIWGSTGPNGYDCSGLMVASYAAAGVSLPRTSYGQASAGVAVSVSQLQPGDLVLFNGNSHVGMYIGGGQIVHAATSKTGVIISPLNSMSIASARRVG